MNNLSTFTFTLPSGQSFAVRVIDRDGSPWFVAADVCRALDMARMRNGHVNAAQAIKPLPEDERAICSVYTPMPVRPDHRTKMYAISESGLYRLIMRSDKPEARAFQDWVTRDVLPAIRKDGMYVMGEEKVKTGEMTLEELTIHVMQGWKAKAERLEAELAEAQPKLAIAAKVVNRVRGNFRLASVH